MADELKNKKSSGVDKGLVAMFLKMSPEMRLEANDNAVCVILELRNACQQQQNKECKPKRNH